MQKAAWSYGVVAMSEAVGSVWGGCMVGRWWSSMEILCLSAVAWRASVTALVWSWFVVKSNTMLGFPVMSVIPVSARLGP
eukprot:7350353-Pyramimonas_sp.AAC.1